MDFDVGYAHLSVQEPTVDFTDSEGHELKGQFDAVIDIVGASVTFRWVGPRESPLPLPEPPGKEAVSYTK